MRAGYRFHSYGDRSGAASSLILDGSRAFPSIERAAFPGARAGQRDQPGMIPHPAEEQLDPRFQPQIVFFRSNEPPGTIIVHTSERFLYVWSRAALRRRCWPRRLSMAGPFEDLPKRGVAGLNATR